MTSKRPLTFSAIVSLINVRSTKKSQFTSSVVTDRTRPLLPGSSFSMKSRMPSVVKLVKAANSIICSALRVATLPQIMSVRLLAPVDQTSSFGRLPASCTICRSTKDSDISSKPKCFRLMSLLNDSTRRQPPTHARPHFLSARVFADSFDSPAPDRTLQYPGFRNLRTRTRLNECTFLKEWVLSQAHSRTW